MAKKRFRSLINYVSKNYLLPSRWRWWRRVASRFFFYSYSEVQIDLIIKSVCDEIMRLSARACGNWKWIERQTRRGKEKKNIPTIPVSSFFRWNNPEEQIKAVVFTEISRSIVWERIWGLGASWQVAPFRLYPSLISIEVAYNREFRHENLTKERAYRKLKRTRINGTFITNQRTSKSIWT